MYKKKLDNINIMIKNLKKTSNQFIKQSSLNDGKKNDQI